MLMQAKIVIHWLVGWSLTSLFSTNTAISESLCFLIRCSLN